MLVITKGEKILEVTMGAYKEYFQLNGWEVVDETPYKTAGEPDMSAEESGGSNHTPGEDEGHSNSDTGSGGEEVSLDKMSDMELKQYAALLDIKTNNMSRKKLIEAIQAKQQK